MIKNEFLGVFQNRRMESCPGGDIRRHTRRFFRVLAAEGVTSGMTDMDEGICPSKEEKVG